MYLIPHFCVTIFNRFFYGSVSLIFPEIHLVGKSQGRVRALADKAQTCKLLRSTQSQIFVGSKLICLKIVLRSKYFLPNLSLVSWHGGDIGTKRLLSFHLYCWKCSISYKLLTTTGVDTEGEGREQGKRRRPDSNPWVGKYSRVQIPSQGYLILDIKWSTSHRRGWEIYCI